MATNDPGWRPNERGICPPHLKGTARMVFVELRNGKRPVASWPADTGRFSANTNWKLTGSDWDILKWKESK